MQGKDAEKKALLAKINCQFHLFFLNYFLNLLIILRTNLKFFATQQLNVY
jgi:hypothetical protein